MLERPQFGLTDENSPAFQITCGKKSINCRVFVDYKKGKSEMN